MFSCSIPGGWDGRRVGEGVYFVSGSNHAGEIRGLALTGNAVGIAACEVNEAALQELELYAPGPLQVFVDSGAFSEVSFPNGIPTITAPISPAEWDKRLRIYERLAVPLRTQLYVVAPDCVAHQEKTLERLMTYRERILALANDHRVNVIVPVQKGALSMDAFRKEVARMYGPPAERFIWGVPMKKDATSLDELAAFCQGLHQDAPLARIHFLGLGPKSPRYNQACIAALCNAPGLTINSDSVRITALVGRTNGPGGGPRALTAARDQLLAAGVTGTADVKAAGKVIHPHHPQGTHHEARQHRGTQMKPNRWARMGEPGGDCLRCNGHGKEDVDGHFNDGGRTIKCRCCGGSGIAPRDVCRACKGRGVLWNTADVGPMYLECHCDGLDGGGHYPPRKARKKKPEKLPAPQLRWLATGLIKAAQEKKWCQVRAANLRDFYRDKPIPTNDLVVSAAIAEEILKTIEMDKELFLARGGHEKDYKPSEEVKAAIRKRFPPR